jgi:hypothetical protein
MNEHLTKAQLAAARHATPERFGEELRELFAEALAFHPDIAAMLDRKESLEHHLMHMRFRL